MIANKTIQSKIGILMYANSCNEILINPVQQWSAHEVQQARVVSHSMYDLLTLSLIIQVLVVNV